MAKNPGFVRTFSYSHLFRPDFGAIAFAAKNQMEANKDTLLGVVFYLKNKKALIFSCLGKCFSKKLLFQAHRQIFNGS